MSAVWLARDDVLDRDVAVKMLHIRRLESAEAVERFEREARTLASLTHPGIVTVIDRGDDHGRPFIVFEYVRGRDLRERIADEGRLPLDDVARDRRADRRRPRLRARARRDPPRRQAAQHPADAGRSAQADRLRHRARPRAAGAHHRGPRARHGRLPGARAGGGRRRSTRAPTCYALGVAALPRALRRACPTTRTATSRRRACTRTRRSRASATLRPDAPERLDEIVRRALAKRPEDRYPDGAAMRDDLAEPRRRAARGLPDTDEVEPTPLAPSARSRRRRSHRRRSRSRACRRSASCRSIPGEPRRGLRIASIALLIAVLAAGGAARRLPRARPRARATRRPTTHAHDRADDAARRHDRRRPRWRRRSRPSS